MHKFIAAAKTSLKCHISNFLINLQGIKFRDFSLTHLF